MHINTHHERRNCVEGLHVEGEKLLSLREITGRGAE
jgi:hypothetical protein